MKTRGPAFKISSKATIYSHNIEYVNTRDILYLPQNMAYTANRRNTEMITIHFVMEHARNPIASDMTIEYAAYKNRINDSKYLARVVKNVLAVPRAILRSAENNI